MTQQSLPWDQPGWLKDAHAWIRAALDAHNIRIIGAIEQFHIRPWSTVLSVPTAAGILYFKATAPTLAFEPALTALLAQLRPDVIPDLLAVDLQRKWMLMRDSGTPLRVFIKAEKSLERWRGILPLYVDLQKQLMPRIEQILALGVFDRRLETLPIQFEHLVADEPSMLVGQPEGLTPDEYQRLKAAGRAFEQMCVELASLGIPATLHHDDFHDGNLFLHDGRIRFTDWGESAVTHPFFTLVVLLRGASNSLDLASDAPELAQLRDWYLSQWTGYASLAELEPMIYLAQQIGLVNRALTWHRVIAGLPESLISAYATAVPSYLQEFINTQAPAQ
jgi:hypothetical protein